MTVTLCVANEEQLEEKNVDKSAGRGCSSAFGDLFRSLKNLPPSMYKVLAVTAVTWVRSTVRTHAPRYRTYVCL
jgi:solute carrier family 45, member 1/2/4